MWTHLSRYKGGIGMRGPGEKQLEEDRRLVAHRIQDLKAKLGKIQARKEREVAGRGDVPTVSLVGYTNAGKSTLMNALTDAGVLVEDKLFATLDTRTRRWQFRGGGHVLLSDTVGFIRDLPHALVASFKATLEEARQADLLLHVVDASSPEAEKQIDGRQRGAGRAWPGRPPDAAGAQQDRPGPGPLVSSMCSWPITPKPSRSARPGATAWTAWNWPCARRCTSRPSRPRSRPRVGQRPRPRLPGPARPDPRPPVCRRSRRPRIAGCPAAAWITSSEHGAAVRMNGQRLYA